MAKSTKSGPKKARRKLFIFSVMDPSLSGFGVHTMNYCRVLKNDFDILIVAPDTDDLSSFRDAGISITTLSKFRERRDQLEGMRIYNIANNNLHLFSYSELKRVPGIIAMHDFNLFWMLSNRDAEGTQAFWYELGPVGTDAYVRGRASTNDAFIDLMPNILYFNRLVLDKAVAVITHSDYISYRIAAYDPRLPVSVIPLFPNFSDQTRRTVLVKSKADLREALGIPQNKLIFSSFGYVAPHKRLDLAVAALGQLAQRHKDFEFHIVGKGLMPELQQLIKSSGLEEHIRVVDRFVSEAEMASYMRASDIIFNLRFTTAGESSGVLVQSMAAETCCIVNTYSTFLDYPEDTLCGVPLHDVAGSEVDRLGDMLIRLYEDRELPKNIARAAKRHADSYSLEAYARQYKVLLDKLEPDYDARVNTRSNGWSSLTASAHWGNWETANSYPLLSDDKVLLSPHEKSYLEANRDFLRASMAYVPLGGESNNALELAAYGDSVARYLNQHNGYGRVLALRDTDQQAAPRVARPGLEVHTKSMAAILKEGIPSGDRSHDLVVLWDYLHLLRQPFLLLKEINRVLRFNGFISLSLPTGKQAGTSPFHLPPSGATILPQRFRAEKNVAEPGTAPLTVDDLRLMLREAGFVVTGERNCQELYPPELLEFIHHAEPHILVMARKVSEVIDYSRHLGTTRPISGAWGLAFDPMAANTLFTLPAA